MLEYSSEIDWVTLCYCEKESRSRRPANEGRSIYRFNG